MQKKISPKKITLNKNQKNTYYNIKASQDNQKNPPRKEKKTKTKQQNHIHLV